MIKTRLQLQGELVKQGANVKIYRGVLHAFYQVGKHDGIIALQKGLVPSLGFQFILNFFRYVSAASIGHVHIMVHEINFSLFAVWAYSIQCLPWGGPEIVMAINHFGWATFGAVWVAASARVRPAHFSSWKLKYNHTPNTILRSVFSESMKGWYMHSRRSMQLVELEDFIEELLETFRGPC